MKRVFSSLLACALLLMCLTLTVPSAQAATRAQTTRTIAIVFDNSGSMYSNGQKAWCRATYAMEVFASMLNDGDELLIYPMSPIEVENHEYTMDDPLKITDPSQAVKIREIYTKHAGTTPIESIDAAAAGLKAARTDKKYLIVLTDGDKFWNGRTEYDHNRTGRELTAYFDRYAGDEMHVLYLGIGSGVAMPSKEESEYFSKAQAAKSENVLSELTKMCNQIFGRDTLPKNHINGKQIDFDISISKLIVFVQGRNISDVRVTDAGGQPVGEQVGSATTMYSTVGCGNHKSVVDDSLQGMLVTYENCRAGTYTLSFDGEESSVEVYYEPDADLDVKFTDAGGREVKPPLYPGDYTVEYGMRDAVTGELITSSDLLGLPRFSGAFSVNGVEEALDCEGMSGKKTVHLNVDDTFSAQLTVTYLSGYTITKSTKDFGWPEGGLKVSRRPAGQLELELELPDEIRRLSTLEESTPARARVYYEGRQLSGAELQAVEITWDPELSGALLLKEFQGDYYDILFRYRGHGPNDEPYDPLDTRIGDFSFPMTAQYTPPESAPAESEEVEFSYSIEDAQAPVSVKLRIPQSYFQFSELEAGKPLKAELTSNGQPLTPEEMARTALELDCSGLTYTLEPQPEDSSYLIRLQRTPDLKNGKYDISCKATLRDEIGRAETAEDHGRIELGRMARWVRYAIALGALLVLLAIIMVILHIRALPTKLQSKKADSSMTVDGDDQTKNTSFTTTLDKGSFKTQVQFASKTIGLQIPVKAAKDSYVKTPQKKRKAEAEGKNLKKIGSANIQEASIGVVKFVLSDETRRLERVPKNDKPFVIKNGMTVSYSGTFSAGGTTRQFAVKTKLSIKK